MTNKETKFDFLTAEEDAPFGGDDIREPLDPQVGKKKTPRSRVLLLLLLLLVVAGAGYFYLLMPPPVEQQPPPPARRSIAIPVKPPIATTPATAPAPTPAATATAVPIPIPVPVPVPAEKTASPAPAPAGPGAASALPAGKAPAVAGKEIPVVANQPAPAPKTEGAAAPVKTAGTAPPAVAAAPVPAAGNYTIDAGAFLLKSNRLAAEKIIRRLGYQPQVKTIKRPVKMVRLRLGGPYTPMEAEAKLKEMAAAAPDSFAVSQGEDQMMVYAGSYHSLDQARVYADRLYQKGIRVEEETAEVPMLLHLVTFGSFADKAEASEILTRARAAGLESNLLAK